MKTIRSVLGIAGLVFVSASRLFAQTNLVNLANVEISPYGAYAVAVSGRYAYVANGGRPGGVGTGLSIFDISNAAAPVDLGFSDHTPYCMDVDVYEDTAYVIYGVGHSGTLTMLDISNPTNPVPVGYVGGDYWQTRVWKRFAYLTGANYGGETGLFIYDASDPTTPVRIGLITNGSPKTVEIGGYVYANASPIGWLVYHASTPDKPRCVAVAHTFNQWANAIISGEFAYHSGVSNSLDIYNVSNPTNPVLVCQPMYVEASMLAVSGNYLYVGAPGGWSVFDVTNPTNATHVAQASNGGGDIMVSGGYAYIAGYPYFSITSLGMPPPPPLSILASSTNTLVLTWPAPNPAFVLQHKSDLNTDNWITLPDTPFVVASRNEIIIPAPANRMFYRLVSQ